MTTGRSRRAGVAAAVATAVAAFAVVAVMFLVSACKTGRSAHEAPRLVILYVPCTVSRAHMSSYDPEVAYTPSFKRFAERGQVFERHHTESGQSGIAYAALFSGSQADLHGVFKHPRLLRDELLLIPEIFAAGGYETFSWLHQRMATTRLRYGQGIPDANAYTGGPLTGEAPEFHRILERLVESPDYRAFIVTDFTVTHGPYEGLLLDELCSRFPGECAARGTDEEIAKYKQLFHDHERPLSVDYDNTVAELGLTEHDQRRLREINEILYKADMYRLDKMFGEVIDAVDEAGLFDQSLIAFTADHGEILWRDNALFHWTHGFQLASEVIQIPWLLSGPRAGVPGGRYTGVTRSIDVLPTLAGLAGIEPGKEYQGTGTDLSATIRGESRPPDLTAFAHTSLRYAPLRAKRMELLSSLFPTPEPKYMWVVARRRDLYMRLARSADDVWSARVYDLAADPGETTDLFDPNDAEHAQLLADLRAYKSHMEDASLQAEAPMLPRKEAIELLRSMGYLE